MTYAQVDADRTVIATRRFAPGDQRSFALLSGDFNPVHTDPVVARRGMFGGVVVHGVHTLLWALDAHLSGGSGSLELTGIRASFPKPVRPEEDASTCVEVPAEPTARLTVRVGMRVCAKIEARFSGRQRSGWPGVRQSGETGLSSPRDMGFDQAALASGQLPIFLDAPRLASMFPALSERLPAYQVAVLLAATRLVGMECPGLHSIFCEMDLRFDPGAAGELRCAYKVKRADDRFSMIVLDVSAPGVSGELTTCIRPAPVKQGSMIEVADVVKPDEFTDQRALVIGGSRGLGETTAKLIAGGGGDVRITYRRGREDAGSVVQAIRLTDGRCECFPFDVLDASIDLGRLVTDQWHPTHLYYFASPRIELNGGAPFSQELHRRYVRFYVESFQRVVEGICGSTAESLPPNLFPRGGTHRSQAPPGQNSAARSSRTGTDLVVFYPSTIFLNEPHPGAAEYCAAKAAGEQLCVHLGQTLPGVLFHCPRLPRMRTDQTVGLLPVTAQDPLGVMLAALRSLPI